MDRNTVIGLSLIFLIMMAWSYWSMPSPEELEQQRMEQIRRDSLAAVQEATGERSQTVIGASDDPGVLEAQGFRAPASGLFAGAAEGDTLRTVVETPLYRAVFTTLGGGPSEIHLLDHQTWDGRPVQMIADTLRSAYSLGFLSEGRQNIETNTLVFRALDRGAEETDTLRLAPGETAQLAYRLQVDEDRYIDLVYGLDGDSHEMTLDVELQGLDESAVGDAMDLTWRPALQFTERDPTQDGQYASSYVYAGGELEPFRLADPGRQESRINGTIEWVSTRTKFFTQVIRPRAPTEAALLTGEVTGDPADALTRHHYQAAVQVDIAEADRFGFDLFVGPLRYYDLREFEESAYDMVDLGYAWMRWFADPLVKWAILPFFSFMSQFIPNYGVLIILFGLMVKLVLTPLTLSSFRSMAAMRELQPLMAELREKHKDNPQKLQQENLKLYRQHKVNPLGGCLPMLLQFPILITLWRFFQSSILIRQKDFLWASDLSAPDYLVTLPFAIPFLGDQIAGFVVLMAGSILLQTKVSGSMTGAPSTPGAPNMKVLMYMMPVMLLFFFNNFASGLSLYYLVFNLLSIGQQAWINRSTHATGLTSAKEESAVGTISRSRVMDSGKGGGKGAKGRTGGKPSGNRSKK